MEGTLGRVWSKSLNFVHEEYLPTCPTPLSSPSGCLLTLTHFSMNSLICSIQQIPVGFCPVLGTGTS